jgi:uncharacterized membrane protein
MSDPGAGTPRRTGTTWLVVRVLLAVGIVVPLLVPFYAKETPELFGFPFFYWFQFLMIPVVSLLTYTAFRLSLRATAQDRPAFGLPAEPADDTEGERC